jgi:hypothetical protein
MLDSLGNCYTFGLNNEGELADGTSIPRTVPIPVRKGVQYAIASQSFTLIRIGDVIEMWGVLLFERGLDATFKAMIGIDEEAKEIQLGRAFSLVLTQSGNMYTSGNSIVGQLGSGTTLSSLIAMPVNMDGALLGKNVTSIYTYRTGSLVIDSGGEVFVWGAIPPCGKREDIPSKLSISTLIGSMHVSLNNIVMLSISGTRVVGCFGGYVGEVMLSNEMHSQVFTSISTLDDDSFYLRTNQGLIVMVGVDSRLKSALDVVPFFTVETTTVDGFLKQTPFFNTSDIHRVIYWKVATDPVIIVLCKDGMSYIRNSTTWANYVDAIPTACSKDIIVTTNGSMIVFHNGKIITLDLLPSDNLKKVLMVTKSAGTYDLGITGVFATCTKYFVGANCDVPVCFDIDANNAQVCGGRGRCVSPQNCICSSPFKGTSCEIQDCGSFRAGDSCEYLSVLSYVLIALGSMFALVMVILALVLLFCTCRYRGTVVKQEQAEVKMKDMLKESLLRADSLEEKIDRDWVIPFTDLVFVEKLAEGSFGVVMSGRYQSAEVAIKSLKDLGGSLSEQFEHEVKILRALRHPNIVLFMGVALNSDQRFIVTELMSGKSLDRIVHKKSSSKKLLHNALRFKKKVSLLLDVVKGMLYLHSSTPAIIHRDLKPSVSRYFLC